MSAEPNHHFLQLERAEGGRLDNLSMRARNQGMLLRRIWCSGATSRADLARETGLSRSATSGLVESLLEANLVEETGAGVSRGGRRPTLLRFADEAYRIIGIDLGASHISAAITNLRGRVDAWVTQPCPVRHQPKIALEMVRGMVSDLMQEAQIAPEELLGVGLAVASPVNPKTPGRLPPLFMPEWRRINLLTDLQLPHNPPLLIDNDANVGALAEAWWGAGKDGSSLAFIKLGTGVGAGFVINGRIFRGHGGTAGEIGHMVIDPHGPECVCGLKGCLVTFLGTPALLASARKAAQQPDSHLVAHEVDLNHLLAAVREGDRAARAVITEAAQRLGLAVAGLLNLMNPEVVVLGGQLASAGDALLHPLRERVQRRSFWTAVSHSRIVASELGARDVALGAATLVLQESLLDPGRFFDGWRV
ncbi:MAG: ROK family protein [Bradymonadia bacterium]